MNKSYTEEVAPIQFLPRVIEKEIKLVNIATEKCFATNMKTAFQSMEATR